MIDNKDFQQAWDRVARTHDGLVIYRHLQRVVMGLAPADIHERALPHFEGRRSLAADLMAFMSEGIAENDRACITFAIAKPAASSGTRGAGRRISAATFISGYDQAGNAGGSNPGANGTGNSAGN